MSPSFSPSPHADAFDRLRTRWRDLLTGGADVDPGDPAVAKVLSALTARVASNGRGRDPLHGTGIWDRLETAPGRTALWADLAGSEKSVALTTAYHRIFHLARAVVTPGGALSGNDALLADTLAALEWMHAHRYHPGQAMYDNWWHWRIGVPLELNNTVALLYEQLSAEQRARYLATVEHFKSDPTIAHDTPATGANRMWSSEIVGLRGVLVKDADKIAAARDAISQLLDEVETGDGFYADGSFVQHDRHPYTGGYGLSLIADLTDFLYLYQGSPWEVTDPDADNVFRWLRAAFDPFMVGGELLDVVRGREVSRSSNTSQHAGDKLVRAFLRASEFAPPAHLADLRPAIKAWLSAGAGCDDAADHLSALHDVRRAQAILADATIAPRPALTGHFRFPAMDRVVHRRPGWSAALGLHSSRIYNYESINGENVRGWHTGAGMMYLCNGDVGHYCRDYWPTVDARRLAGTTVEAGGTPPESRVADTDLVGGVESDDGTCGVAGMDLAPAGSALRGRKAWFFLADQVVCLGAGIGSSDTRTVETVVENRRLKADGKNRLRVGGETGIRAALPEFGPTVDFRGVTWAHLAGGDADSPAKDIGYCFPDGAELKGRREIRTGAWSSINRMSEDAIERRNPFLTLWLDHGVAPVDAGYAYVVLPGWSAAATEAYSSAPPVRIESNRGAVQAVVDTRDGTRGAIFWREQATTIGLGQDAVTVRGPAAVMIQVRVGGLHITASDPSHKASTVIVEIARPATVIQKTDTTVTVERLAPTIRLTIDVAGARGKTHRASFRLD